MLFNSIILIMLFVVYFLPFLILGDTPVAYQLGFQDPVTTTMEGIYLFNLHLLFIIINILIVLGWSLFLALVKFNLYFAPRYLLSHGVLRFLMELLGEIVSIVVIISVFKYLLITLFLLCSTCKDLLIAFVSVSGEINFFFLTVFTENNNSVIHHYKLHVVYKGIPQDLINKIDVQTVAFNKLITILPKNNRTSYRYGLAVERFSNGTTSNLYLYLITCHSLQDFKLELLDLTLGGQLFRALRFDSDHDTILDNFVKLSRDKKWPLLTNMILYGNDTLFYGQIKSKPFNKSNPKLFRDKTGLDFYAYTKLINDPTECEINTLKSILFDYMMNATQNFNFRLLFFIKPSTYVKFRTQTTLSIYPDKHIFQQRLNVTDDVTWDKILSEKANFVLGQVKTKYPDANQISINIQICNLTGVAHIFIYITHSKLRGFWSIKEFDLSLDMSNIDKKFSGRHYSVARNSILGSNITNFMVYNTFYKKNTSHYRVHFYKNIK